MNLKAINKYLLIKELEKNSRTKSGLLLGADDKVLRRYMRAKIVSAGNMVDSVSDGDVIYYDKMGSGNFEVLLEGERYAVIQERDIILVE